MFTFHNPGDASRLVHLVEDQLDGPHGGEAVLGAGADDAAALCPKLIAIYRGATTP